MAKQQRKKIERPYLDWVWLANEFWIRGMHDKGAIERHAILLEQIARLAKGRAEVDFNETLLELTFNGIGHTDRRAVFWIWRLHGKALVTYFRADRAAPPAIRASRAATEHVFGLLNEPRPRKKKGET
jgi:hypothetical protein